MPLYYHLVARRMESVLGVHMIIGAVWTLDLRISIQSRYSMSYTYSKSWHQVEKVIEKIYYIWEKTLNRKGDWQEKNLQISNICSDRILKGPDLHHCLWGSTDEMLE